MGEVRIRTSTRPRAPRQHRPVPRYTLVSDVRREPLSVRNFIRALTRFQPSRDTWHSEIPEIQSRVSEEFRRLHRRDNADFILSPRSPHSEFRPRSAHPDCKKEFVPKTNICFGNPEQRIPRRCIKSAPPSIQRSVPTASPRPPGRFEHNILQDEYFELRSMLRQSVQQKDTLEDIISRPAGVYSSQYPSTNHRIFCVEDKVGMGYFKKFRNDLLDNLTLDLEGIRKGSQEDARESAKVVGHADDTAAMLNYVPENEAGEKDVPKISARSASSVGTSVSSFNSNGEVQIGSKRKDSQRAVKPIPTVGIAEDFGTSTTKDVSTSTADDLNLRSSCSDKRSFF